ncbi:hypothetical protein J27TS7_01440 [Paenibacillus dendritiformis]|nr:hypothetical protein J27TS7_01440 [Paenibacillus dendritiformis]
MQPQYSNQIINLPVVRVCQILLQTKSKLFVWTPNFLCEYGINYATIEAAS